MTDWPDVGAQSSASGGSPSAPSLYSLSSERLPEEGAAGESVLPRAASWAPSQALDTLQRPLGGHGAPAPAVRKWGPGRQACQPHGGGLRAGSAGRLCTKATARAQPPHRADIQADAPLAPLTTEGAHVASNGPSLFCGAQVGLEPFFVATLPIS